MRYIENLAEALNENESIVGSCDDCDNFLAINLKTDLIRREYIEDFYAPNHGEWISHYKCLCGSEFFIKD